MPTNDVLPFRLWGPVVALVGSRVAPVLFCSMASLGPSSAQSAAEDLELGRRLFLRHCAECHGANGDGWGERHEITYARPRSFMSARFKLSTTENRIPSNEDLERTIRRGMPGSGMPSWSQLDREEISALARFVRELGVAPLRVAFDRQVAEGRLSREEADLRLAEKTVPGPPVLISPETELTPEGEERGQRIYLEACAACHGPAGDSPPGLLMTDLEGNWLPPTSLSKGVFKGGFEGERIYARIVKGIDGTAMPAFEGAYSGEQLWNLVHYVQLLSTEGYAARVLSVLKESAGVGIGPVSEVVAETAAEPLEPTAPENNSIGETASDRPADPRTWSKRRLDLWIALAVLVIALGSLVRWLKG